MYKSELSKRLISGFSIAFFAYWIIYFSSQTIFIAAVFLVATIAIFEFERAIIGRGTPLRSVIFYFSHVLTFGAGWFFWKEDQENALICLAVLLAVNILASLFAKREKETLGIFWYTIPSVWISLPFFLLIPIRFFRLDGIGSHLIFFLVVTVAFNDIFAYFGGKKFGKRLLAPKISPKKTIEGTFFGYVGAILMGSIVYSIYFKGTFSYLWIVITIILVTFSAQVGDLLESKFKRYCGIKDSSNIIPGHGGVLDRFDALLTAIPLFWILLVLNEI